LVPFDSVHSDEMATTVRSDDSSVPPLTLPSSHPLSPVMYVSVVTFSDCPVLACLASDVLISGTALISVTSVLGNTVSNTVLSTLHHLLSCCRCCVVVVVHDTV
jgi:uncharacterized membrane protein YdjX (TVP38/TMEM64 family)